MGAQQGARARGPARSAVTHWASQPLNDSGERRRMLAAVTWRAGCAMMLLCAGVAGLLMMES